MYISLLRSFLKCIDVDSNMRLLRNFKMRCLAIVAVFAFASGITVGVEIMIETTSGSIEEGENMVIMCRIDVADPTRDISARLFAETTSIAEDGFDAEPIGNFVCTISAGQLVGTVSIPTFIDNVFDDGEIYVIGGIPLDPIDTSSMMAPFALTDVASAFGTDVTIRPRELTYESFEGETITIVVEFYDNEGKAVPLEEDYMLAFNFIDGTATGGMTNAAPDDYDNSDTMGVDLLGSMGGMITLSTVITIPIIDDGLVESTETFSFTLIDAGVPGIIVDPLVMYTVAIIDIDRPSGLYVLNENAVLPRKSKEPVRMVAFTGGPNDGIDLQTRPWESECTGRDLRSGYNGQMFTFTRPTKRTRSRFTEYAFSATETVNSVSYDYEATTHISATNHRRGLAPINTGAGTTITAYPDPHNSELLEEPVTIAIDPKVCPIQRNLRWSHYGPSGREKRLHKYKGSRNLELTERSEAGLYVIFRFRRRQIGWVQYVRVILAECPKGMFHLDSATQLCDGGPIECQHGGMVDPAFSEGLCICPPGYIGGKCEIPTDPGRFGNSGEFDVSDFFETTRGRGITFVCKSPLGSTCFPGFRGPGCKKDCRHGYFGPGCAFQCNCSDDHCNESGICENGCQAGYGGETCQDIVVG